MLEVTETQYLKFIKNQGVRRLDIFHEDKLVYKIGKESDTTPNVENDFKSFCKDFKGNIYKIESKGYVKADLKNVFTHYIDLRDKSETAQKVTQTQDFEEWKKRYKMEQEIERLKAEKIEFENQKPSGKFDAIFDRAIDMLGDKIIGHFAGIAGATNGVMNKPNTSNMNENNVNETEEGIEEVSRSLEIILNKLGADTINKLAAKIERGELTDGNIQILNSFINS